MKKQILAVLLVLVTGAAMAQTAPENQPSKLSFEVIGKLGFARLKQTDAVPLNGNINGGDFLLAYKISPTWNIASGVGYFEYNANTTIAGNTASLKNSYLHIPVQFNGDYTIFGKESSNSNRISFNIGLGLYANTLLKQELETVTTSTDTSNMGWNFGFSSQVGAKFTLSDALNIGIGLESQSDFTKMKKDGVEQRIDQMNAIYFKFGLTF